MTNQTNLGPGDSDALLHSSFACGYLADSVVIRYTGRSPVVALTIAGSDNSAGAGIQADLKTFSAHHVYGLTALTCVVAEVPGKVSRIQAVDLEVVREQVALSFEAFPVAALKTGMLFSREIVELVAELYGALPGPRPLLVVDPVMVASSGDPLLSAGAVTAYRERLFPLAAVVTPNLDEARALLDGAEIPDLAALNEAGHAMCARFGVPFLMKGGHLAHGGTGQAVDLLVWPGGEVESFSAPFTAGVQTHGTGCTYAAAVTAGLAHGRPLAEAVRRAKGYVSAAVAGFHRWERPGRGAATDALNHFPATGSTA